MWLQQYFQFAIEGLDPGPADVTFFKSRHKLF